MRTKVSALMAAEAVLRLPMAPGEDRAFADVELPPDIRPFDDPDPIAARA
jgi:hypothetical protein